jgi:hypothetical protein
MSYGEIIRTAFGITRRNRHLWFFGLFAGAGVNVPAPNFGGNFNFQGPDRSDAAVPWSTLAQGDAPSPGVLVAIGVAVLVVVLALIALSLLSQGALADSVAAIDRGGERSFRAAWHAGARSFWRMLGLAALILAIFLAAVIVVGVPLGLIVWGVFSATEAVAPRILVGVVAGLVALAALLVLFILLPLIGQLAVRELVLREGRPVASFRAGLALFRAHLGKSLLLWLILLGIGIGAAIALLIAALLVGLVLALPAIGLAIGGLEVAAIIAGVIAGVILLALFIVALAALGTFNHAYWTLGYLRLRALEAAAGPAAPAPGPGPASAT